MGEPLQARVEVVEIGPEVFRVKVMWFGLSVLRKGSAAGPNKRGLVQTNGRVASSRIEADLVAGRTRRALEFLGIEEEPYG